MVLKRKKKREYSKELRIEKGVFDRKTMLALYYLLNKGFLDEIIGVLKEGKESVVLSGKAKKEFVAIKVYRTWASDFKTIWKYIVGDPRFAGVKKNRMSIVYLWCKREFKNLMTAFEAGVNCPKPIACKENILVMSFIGVKGIPAPRLIDIVPENPKKVYRQVISDMKKLAKTGLVHGDLSPYNVLFLEAPFLIDFSHATTVKNPIVLELLERDVKHINSYFNKLNISLKDSKSLFEELKAFIKPKND